MRNRREIVLKAFLHKCAPEKRDLLLSFLPDSEKNALEELPDIPLPKKESFELDRPLDSIHWSWLIPVLKTYPVKEQKFFLCALHPSAQKNLAKTLHLTLTTEKISAIGTIFLRSTLIQNLCKKDLLPIHLLPPSPLNLLLQIEKKKLIQLIDLLSLFDLSAEIRQIVETKILKKIYSFLSEEEKHFLKMIAGQREPYPAARIRLGKWDGTRASFRLMLHRIGLARLGAALSGQDSDLIWYVCHRLDSGRGKALKKLCKKEAMPHVAEWLAEQMKEFL